MSTRFVSANRAKYSEIVNAIFYWPRGGVQWRLLPHDFPRWMKVYYYWSKWQRDGTWRRLNDALREFVREEAGREPTPSVAAIDSQTVKVTETASERGYDGGKRVNGRKRHIVVDSMGLLLAVTVTAANLDDGTHAPRVLRKIDPGAYPRLHTIRADSKYNNDTLDAWLCEKGGPWALEFRPKQIAGVDERPKGFVPISGRWVVERTFAWLGCWRRLSKDYERTISASEATVQGAMVHFMLRRLERQHQAHLALVKVMIPAEQA